MHESRCLTRAPLWRSCEHTPLPPHTIVTKKTPRNRASRHTRLAIGLSTPGGQTNHKHTHPYHQPMSYQQSARRGQSCERGGEQTEHQIPGAAEQAAQHPPQHTRVPSLAVSSLQGPGHPRMRPAGNLSCRCCGKRCYLLQRASAGQQSPEQPCTHAECTSQASQASQNAHHKHHKRTCVACPAPSASASTRPSGTGACGPHIGRTLSPRPPARANHSMGMHDFSMPVRPSGR